MPDPQSQMVMWVNSIAQTATANGGTVVMKYSQSLPPTSTLIGMFGATKGGICQALTNKWIAEHAAGGSLWNWLCSSSGQVQPSKISNLMMNFIDSASMSAPGGIDRQKLISEKYLFQYGVIRRTDIVSGERLYLEGMGNLAPNPAYGATVAKAVVGQGLKNSGGCYRMISFKGTGGGHVVAAWVAEDVAFFDSNFGEFWFEKPANFAKWFPMFWQKAGYGQMFGGCQIRDFAMKKGHVTARPGNQMGRV